ncbi:hypothetical protein P6F26_02600 [Roseibacterium sp. SDUM158017]|uniref:hypothetical protein n=1 Tax=Roseicyclus salinarum TaxID=3036773 RepID=UPI0024156D20|nr:hypothetical protein [Roseibacterium sp. SDUM158017]MDG4647320.1 hypothetical protein [Roseibacterium sp. SDUM158017]
MTRTTTGTAILRTLAAAGTLGLLPMASTPAQASALSDCYDSIMVQCPESLTPYEQCIGEGFDLCDNQHEQPLEAGALDLDFLPPGQRRVVREVLRERGVPILVYRGPSNSDRGEDDRNGGSRGSDRGGDSGRGDSGRDDAGRDSGASAAPGR